MRAVRCFARIGGSRLLGFGGIVGVHASARIAVGVHALACAYVGVHASACKTTFTSIAQPYIYGQTSKPPAPPKPAGETPTKRAATGATEPAGQGRAAVG